MSYAICRGVAFAPHRPLRRPLSRTFAETANRRVCVKELNGRVAVITGGASGIGLAMAEAFGAEGMKLVIADIEAERLGSAVADLRAKSFDAIGVRTDVSTYADVEALAQATLAAFGKVHVVCNNAGVSITGPSWKMSLDDWRWIYDVNFWGVVHGIKAFTPILIEQGEPAHIINTSSEAAFLSIGEHAPYCSSKAAVVSISIALHSELIVSNTQVGVSVVCPGMVDTQIHRSWRNRPTGDLPWSDRESADPDRQRHTDAFQARGVPSAQVAEHILDALKANRFYVFNTDHWQDMVRRQRDIVLSGANPPVYSWGPDLRPKAPSQ
jgi:NAD(P)-dependent dehydrogenase (short-subunit alcohol dehydrogenase family)